MNRVNLTSEVPLSNTQINSYYRGNPAFGGCMALKDVKRFVPGKFVVVDVADPSKMKMGHWCVLSRLNPEQDYWFDPFGFPPPPVVVKLFRGNAKTPRLWYNNVDQQGLRQTDCGERCLRFVNAQLKELGRSKSETKSVAVQQARPAMKSVATSTSGGGLESGRPLKLF